MKKFKIMAAVMLMSSALAAQPAAKKEPEPAQPVQTGQSGLPNASVDVSLQFASNFVFRGDDVHKSNFARKRKSYGSKNEAWTFQPSITFKTPVDGLTFNIWGNFAMTGRQDKDVDQRLNATPTPNGVFAVPTATGDTIGSNIGVDAYDGLCATCNFAGNSPQLTPLLYVRSKLVDPTTYLPANAAAGTTAGSYSGVSNVVAPMFQKEGNGLKRQDELDYTIAYTSATKIGVIGFGIVSYQLVNSRAKANPFSNAGGTYWITEIFASYALPKLPDLSIKSFADIVKSDQYHQLVYSKAIALNDNVSISITTGPGYYVGSGTASGVTVQGWRDVTSSIGVAAYGFNVGLNAAYRPNMRMFDPDLPSSNGKLVEVDGQSPNNDGKAPDPKYVNSGLGYDIINRSITENVRLRGGTTNYVFTPRQKLPKWLYWVNFGYTTSF